MHFNLHKALQILARILTYLLAIAALLIVVSIALIGWSEFLRTRHLERLHGETQLPQELIYVGQYPLTSIFVNTENRICVWHSYKANLKNEEMTLGQSRSVRNLELPYEDLTWYLIAFNGDQISRVLLIDETIEIKLASESRCFSSRDNGHILVQKQSSETSSILKVEFILKE